MAKINCPHCGKKIPDSKLRCPFCRAEIKPFDEKTGLNSNPSGDIAELIGKHINNQKNDSQNALHTDDGLIDGYTGDERISYEFYPDSSNDSNKISGGSTLQENVHQNDEQKISGNNDGRVDNNDDWKQLQRYILNSKVFELGGSFNNIVTVRLENLQLPQDAQNLITFAKDCQYILNIRPNLNPGVRNSLLRRYEESVLRLEQLSPGCPELPQIKINFQSQAKFGVKNILSFLK